MGPRAGRPGADHLHPKRGRCRRDRQHARRNLPRLSARVERIDIAINKAFTAKAFDISTLELGRNSQPGGQFFGIHVSNHDRVMIFAGGIPIKTNGQIVGAVGVSGGSGEQDQAVAEAVVAASS